MDSMYLLSLRMYMYFSLLKSSKILDKDTLFDIGN